MINLYLWVFFGHPVVIFCICVQSKAVPGDFYGLENSLKEV